MDKGYKIRDQNGLYFVTFAVVEWVDVFTRKEYADIVVESLIFCQKIKGLEIYSWCLMSNHLHLIVAAKEGYYLSDILRDFKKYTAKEILSAIDQNQSESRRNWMLWIFKQAGIKNTRNSSFQFWRQSNQPKELLTNRFKDQKLEYIHNNPVESGIVKCPQDYVYSSAINYSGEQGLIDVILL
ncbi:transposase [Mangrovivirga sp. M17]|uniref:Transposase n=1 Tax=Mangrovivirga halotolerans TaxID=2993936 RepID=A0ABT3RM87_9BACT|nr:transposase [Mangrovivirga halotolerans]MCX2742681.1 transposase [Mangrovivirga halotolerans]